MSTTVTVASATTAVTVSDTDATAVTVATVAPNATSIYGVAISATAPSAGQAIVATSASAAAWADVATQAELDAWTGAATITTVGTLSAGAVPASLVTAGTFPAGAFAFQGAVSGVTTLTATTLAGTLSTAAQPNVTSVGTLTSLTITGLVQAGSLSVASTQIDTSGRFAIRSTPISGFDIVTGDRVRFANLVLGEIAGDFDQIQPVSSNGAKVLGALTVSTTLAVTGTGTFGSATTTGGTLGTRAADGEYHTVITNAAATASWGWYTTGSALLGAQVGVGAWINVAPTTLAVNFAGAVTASTTLAVTGTSTFNNTLVQTNATQGRIEVNKTGANALAFTIYNDGTSAGLYDSTNARSLWLYTPSLNRVDHPTVTYFNAGVVAESTLAVTGTVTIGTTVTLANGAANRLDLGSGDSLYLSGGGTIGVGTATSATALVALGAGTTALAPLRITHGVAPTSPVDGDIWTTTAGLYVRINGSTVGPLS